MLSSILVHLLMWYSILMFNTCIKLADTPKRQTWKIKEVVVLSVVCSYITTSLKSVGDENFQITKCFKQFCPVSYGNNKVFHWLHIMLWYDCPSLFVILGEGKFENSNFNHPASLIFILIPCFNGPIKKKTCTYAKQNKSSWFKKCVLLFLYLISF